LKRGGRGGQGGASSGPSRVHARGTVTTPSPHARRGSKGWGSTESKFRHWEKKGTVRSCQSKDEGGRAVGGRPENGVTPGGSKECLAKRSWFADEMSRTTVPLKQDQNRRKEGVNIGFASRGHRHRKSQKTAGRTKSKCEGILKSKRDGA